MDIYQEMDQRKIPKERQMELIEAYKKEHKNKEPSCFSEAINVLT